MNSNGPKEALTVSIGGGFRLTMLCGITGALIASGCSSATTPYKIGFKLIGKAVDQAQVADLQTKLVGQPEAVAVTELGPNVDTWREARGGRQWLVFPVKLDPLDKHRYVVETEGDRIVAVSKVERGGANELDIPRRLVLREKVKGKTPGECQGELGMGPPLLTVRSEKSGRSAQLYDARLVELGRTYYCLLRFDAGGRCEELEFVTVEASTKPTLHQ